MSSKVNCKIGCNESLTLEDIIEIRRTLLQLHEEDWNQPECEISGWGSPQTPFVSKLKSPSPEFQLSSSCIDGALNFSPKNDISRNSPDPKSCHKESSILPSPSHKQLLPSIPSLTELDNIILTEEDLPHGVRNRIHLTKLEFEHEFANKRLKSLKSLRKALQIGSQAYLSELRESWDCMRFSDKRNVGGSIESEFRKASIENAVAFAGVQEAVDLLHYRRLTDSLSDRSYTEELLSQFHSIFLLPDESRLLVLQHLEQLKRIRIQTLEAEIQLQMESRTCALQDVIDSKRTEWENKTRREYETIWQRRLQDTEDGKILASKSSIEKLKSMLLLCDFLSEARVKADGALGYFADQLKCNHDSAVGCISQYIFDSSHHSLSPETLSVGIIEYTRHLRALSIGCNSALKKAQSLHQTLMSENKRLKIFVNEDTL